MAVFSFRVPYFSRHMDYIYKKANKLDFLLQYNIYIIKTNFIIIYIINVKKKHLSKEPFKTQISDAI